MKTPQFTPGPWTTDLHVILGGPDNCTSVAETYLAQWVDAPGSPMRDACIEEAKSNARLIAQAPAMYAMLEDAVSMLAKLEGENLSAYAKTFAALAQSRLTTINGKE